MSNERIGLIFDAAAKGLEYYDELGEFIGRSGIVTHLKVLQNLNPELRLYKICMLEPLKEDIYGYTEIAKAWRQAVQENRMPVNSIGEILLAEDGTHATEAVPAITEEQLAAVGASFVKHLGRNMCPWVKKQDNAVLKGMLEAQLLQFYNYYAGAAYAVKFICGLEGPK